MKQQLIKTWYYRQFNADYNLEVPAHGYGGWENEMLPIDPGHTALVVMHAWDCGTRDEFPGWYRAVEYIERANLIASSVFPDLLARARSSDMGIIHVADDSGYAEAFPGHGQAKKLTRKYNLKTLDSTGEEIYRGPVYETLSTFRKNNSFPGKENIADIESGRKKKKFLREALPTPGEPVVTDSAQLHSVCLEYKYNHLVYIGFAINWCLQYSPGNMNDMAKHGMICSTIREAVTAVENRESAETQQHREYGLWLTALKNGFVYALDDFMDMLSKSLP